MKITISHDASSIDPTATCGEEQFARVKAALEAEYGAAILKNYPDAEVDFDGTDMNCSIRVTMDDPSEIRADIQRICEEVFETGMFWA